MLKKACLAETCSHQALMPLHPNQLPTNLRRKPQHPLPRPHSAPDQDCSERQRSSQHPLTYSRNQAVAAIVAASSVRGAFSELRPINQKKVACSEDLKTNPKKGIFSVSPRTPSRVAVFSAPPPIITNLALTYSARVNLKEAISSVTRSHYSEQHRANQRPPEDSSVGHQPVELVVSLAALAMQASSTLLLIRTRSRPSSPACSINLRAKRMTTMMTVMLRRNQRNPSTPKPAKSSSRKESRFRNLPTQRSSSKK